MKMKIKLKIVKMEKAMSIQILEMDERFRHNGEHGRNSFLASNGWLIQSCNYPDMLLTTLKIYLRGHIKEFDDHSIVQRFENNNQRDATVEALMYALEEWSEKWEGFMEKAVEKNPPESSEEVIIFEA